MPFLIETPEDRIKFQFGATLVENIALRAEVERLQRELADKDAPDIDDPAQPDLA